MSLYFSLHKKREIIEKHREDIMQQTMSSNNQSFNRKRLYGNDYPNQNFIPFGTNQHATTQNFALLYDDGPGPSYNHGSPTPNKKRRKRNTWGSDGVNTNQNPGKQQYVPFAGPKGPPKPLMGLSFAGRRMPRKDFTPNKVPMSVHTKTNLEPVPAATVKRSVQPAYTSEMHILRADRVPCQQTTGRLELALGAILKEMKAKFCTVKETGALFNSKTTQRYIKQCIRERIKAVMLNKYVGKYIEVVASYRESYPPHTDKDLMDMAVMKAGASETIIKYNFNKMLTKKLEEMFKKLKKQSEGKEIEVLKIIEAHKTIKCGEKSEADIKQSCKIERNFYISIVDSLLEERLPKLLPNYASLLLKILQNESDSCKKNQDHDNTTIEIRDSDGDEDVLGVKAETDKEVENGVILQTATADTIPVNELTEIKNSEESPEGESNTDNTDAVEKVDSVNNTVVKEEVQTDIATVKEKTDNSIVESKSGDSIVEGITKNTESHQQSQEIGTSNSSSYLVKVLCQPKLPSKAAAYKFLNKFNAVSVKKHKTIHNLLVVELKNDKDFNDITAASGTVIENSKLIIKGNKTEQPVGSPAPAVEAEKEMKDEKEYSKGSNIIPPELENQITDLLSSIRKAEELQREQDGVKDEEPQADVAVDEGKVPTAMNNGTKEEDKVADKNLYSPSNPFDEESAELETIKEAAGEREGNEESAELETIKEAAGEGEGNEESAELETIKDSAGEREGDPPVTSVEPDALSMQGEGTNKEPKSNIKDGRSTPVRSSSRLANATPSTIRTRRASRLAQNN
ncbi:unnamed protein product, partial [Iphiclides podalirius]